MVVYRWQKSSYCTQAANCVYVAAAPDGGVRIRESDEPDAILTTTPDRLRVFLLGVKEGAFDDLAIRPS
ncbi:DUF397 domain-containing protein [Kitasatospora sp. NPDC093806]|uniref:DUF397 domain-containing protein n=1 Tax=Kitasatospora sp. NPDC093806 TaxID=3155075 RepID=UPI00342DBBC8